MKRSLIYIVLSVVLLGIIIGSVLIYGNSKTEVDVRLEPLIIRVNGLTQYTESSEILSLVQYYNEEEELYYYEVQFGYEKYQDDSDELIYKVKDAVFIIDHEAPGDSGDFYFTSELELEENATISSRLESTKANYVALATYEKKELVSIRSYILEK